MNCNHATVLERLDCPNCNEKVTSVEADKGTSLMSGAGKPSKSSIDLWSMTNEDRARYLAGIHAAQSKNRLADFVRHSWHVLEPGVDLSWNWHIEAMADHIQWVLMGWLDRLHGKPSPAPQNLLINVPPGTAKSRIVSVDAPAWFWLHHPEWRVICLSANPKVALRDSVYCRELIASDWYQNSFEPEWQIKHGSDAKGKFENTAGGFRSAQGITATVTGDRGDALFVDDPNDAADVYSEVQRESVHVKWSQAARNRVNNLKNAVRVGVMQRLHEDDWAGRLLSKGGWEHLCLPMEYEPDRACKTSMPFEDPRTEPGEVLHKDRFTPEVLEEERRGLGSMGYAGQMQQRPAPEEGGMFQRKWWKFCTIEGQPTLHRPRPHLCRSDPPRNIILKELDWILVSVDASFKKTESGSKVGMMVIGGHKADRFLLDNRTRPMNFLETCEMIRRLKSEWPATSRILIEDKANGSAIVETLTAEISGIIPVNPEGGKESRAAAIQPAVESGNVYLLDGAEWLESFMHEISVFPNGTHDDQVDALSQALIYMNQSPAVARAKMLGSW